MANHQVAVIMFCLSCVSWAQTQHPEGSPPNLSPNPERLKTLESNPDTQPLMMLKLLKYKSGDGRSSYRKYLQVAVPRIRELGGEVAFYGNAKPIQKEVFDSTKLFGWRASPWDAIVLERYRSRKDFLKLGESDAYRMALIHRRNGLEEALLYALHPYYGDVKSVPKTELSAVYMLNLLKFKPNGGGGAFFQKYGKVVTPLIEKHGGKVICGLNSEQLLIGQEQYDHVILVMYPSVEEFTKMIQSDDYQTISHHRTDAIEIGHLFAFSNETAELESLGKKQ